jgi:3',5'-cyclic AMP phosphodiesterase CpdA
MPPFQIPITQVIRHRNPDARIRRLMSATAVGLEVQAATGRWLLAPRTLIDTGASYTSMSATLARSLELSVPAETSVIENLTARGVSRTRVHDGEIRVRFPQLPGHTFRLYCLFVEETPPSVPVLIGLHDTLEVFRLMFDGRPAPDAPAGRMVLGTV